MSGSGSTASSVTGYVVNPFITPLYGQGEVGKGQIPQSNRDTIRNEILDKNAQLFEQYLRLIERHMQYERDRMDSLDKALQTLLGRISQSLIDRLALLESKQGDCACKLMDHLIRRLAPLDASLEEIESKSGRILDVIQADGVKTTPLDSERREGEGETETETEAETDTDTEAVDTAPLGTRADTVARPNEARGNERVYTELKGMMDHAERKGTEARIYREMAMNKGKDYQCCDLTVYARQLGSMLTPLNLKLDPSALLSMLPTPKELEEREKELNEGAPDSTFTLDMSLAQSEFNPDDDREDEWLE